MHWTKITAALPADGYAVMATVKYGAEKAILIGKFSDGRFYRKADTIDEYLPIPSTFKVTHWMPILAPAEDDE